MSKAGKVIVLRSDQVTRKLGPELNLGRYALHRAPNLEVAPRPQFQQLQRKWPGHLANPEEQFSGSGEIMRTPLKRPVNLKPAVAFTEPMKARKVTLRKIQSNQRLPMPSPEPVRAEQVRIRHRKLSHDLKDTMSSFNEYAGHDAFSVPLIEGTGSLRMKERSVSQQVPLRQPEFGSPALLNASLQQLQPLRAANFGSPGTFDAMMGTRETLNGLSAIKLTSESTKANAQPI